MNALLIKLKLYHVMNIIFKKFNITLQFNPKQSQWTHLYIMTS